MQQKIQQQVNVRIALEHNIKNWLYMLYNYNSVVFVLFSHMQMNKKLAMSMNCSHVA